MFSGSKGHEEGRPNAPPSPIHKASRGRSGATQVQSGCAKRVARRSSSVSCWRRARGSTSVSPRFGIVDEPGAGRGMVRDHLTPSDSSRSFPQSSRSDEQDLGFHQRVESARAQPFVWTKTAEQILAKADRKTTSNSGTRTPTNFLPIGPVGRRSSCRSTTPRLWWRVVPQSPEGPSLIEKWKAKCHGLRAQHLVSRLVLLIHHLEVVPVRIGHDVRRRPFTHATSKKAHARMVLKGERVTDFVTGSLQSLLSGNCIVGIQLDICASKLAR